MKLKLLDSYVLIFLIIILWGLASYIIPSGNFDRQIDQATGITYVVPGSYHIIKQTPVPVFEVFKAIPEGMVQASDIIIFVLIISGSFGVIQATGVINAMIGTIARKYFGKEKIIIPVIMILFSLAGAVFGSAEELLPLIPIFIALAIALGFDVITGTAMVLIGSTAGFATGFLNPFTTGIAQKMSGLPLFSGITYRIICYIVILTSSIIYVYRYASKIKRKPEAIDKLNNEYGFYQKFDIDTLPRLTKRHIAIIAVVLLSFISLIYGVLVAKFNIMDIATLFLIMGIVSGIVGKFKSSRIVTEFINGASNLLYGALIIGLARGITIVMSNGNTIDTVIHQLSKIVAFFSPVLNSVSMLIVHTILSSLITSSTGEASATMPIMVNLADFSGITRQTAVLAYQFGDGFTNIISPASGYFMAALAISGLSWKKWAKWIWPLILIWFALGCTLIIISVIIGYGPF